MGITDGTVWCAWCGEHRTECNLCTNPPLVGPGAKEYNRERQEVRLSATDRQDEKGDQS